MHGIQQQYPKSPGLDELDGFNEYDSFESFDNDDFEAKLNDKPSASVLAVFCCDICDPLHNYYNAHPRRRRLRAGLPRLFYCVSILQMATLFAATITISGDFCGPLPGSLAGQVKATTTTTLTSAAMPLLQPQTAAQKHTNHNRKQQKLSSATKKNTAIKQKKYTTSILPSQSSHKKVLLLLLQIDKFSSKRNPKKILLPNIRRKLISKPALRTSTKKSSTLPTLPTQAVVEDGSIASLENALQQKWARAESSWSLIKKDIKLRAVGEVQPLHIDCKRCEKYSKPSGSIYQFRPFSIVFGAVMPIFLASSIIIVVGVSAVSNYVLIGPQRLICYTLLVVFAAVFSFHFSVVQNVTALRLSDSLHTIAKNKTMCYNIVEHQIFDHQRSDILWALHAVTNIFSALLSTIGLCGWHGLHDEVDD
jgi:hypothetical protein